LTATAGGAADRTDTGDAEILAPIHAVETVGGGTVTTDTTALRNKSRSLILATHRSAAGRASRSRAPEAFGDAFVINLASEIREVVDPPVELLGEFGSEVLLGGRVVGVGPPAALATLDADRATVAKARLTVRRIVP